MLNKVKFTHSAHVGPSPTLPAWGLFRWVWTPGLWPTPTPEGAAVCVCWPVSRLGPGRTGRRPVTRQGSRPAGPQWWWPPNCDLRRRRTTWLTACFSYMLHKRVCCCPAKFAARDSNTVMGTANNMKNCCDDGQHQHHEGQHQCCLPSSSVHRITFWNHAPSCNSVTYQ